MNTAFAETAKAAIFSFYNTPPNYKSFPIPIFVVPGHAVRDRF